MNSHFLAQARGTTERGSNAKATLPARQRGRGVEQWTARVAHNHQVEGSNPSPATNKEGIKMGVKLDGQNLIIDLSDFETRVAKKGMPLLAPFIEFQIKIMCRVVFHLLQIDRQTFREVRQRIKAGEDPEVVMGPFISQINDYLKSTDFHLIDEPSFEEIENLLPSDEEI
jgi:hypothetical protein